MSGSSAVTDFLFGYTTEWSVSPGTDLEVLVSTTAATYRAELVRLIHGDSNPRGPGFKEELVETVPSERFPGRVQVTAVGSYLEVPHELVVPRQFELRAWIFPTRVTESAQGIVARLDPAGRGFGLFLVESGRLELRVGSFRVRTREALERHCWYEVRAAVDADKVARLEARPRVSWKAPAAVAASGVC